MNIVFLTKSLCHHLVSLSDELFKIYGSNFSFIQIREPLDFRVEFHQEGFERDYLVHYAKNSFEKNKAINLVMNADVLICGEAPWNIVKKCNKKSLFFLYSEHIFKNGYFKAGLLSFLLKIFLCIRFSFRLMPYKNKFLLSSSGFAPLEFYLFGMFKDRAFRWGYFPSLNLKDHIKFSNDKIVIVWASRIIKWKHPETLIEISKMLLKNGVNHVIYVVGDGDKKHGNMFEKFKKQIQQNNLNRYFKLLGKRTPKDVVELYSICDFAVFTSDYSEGWGVGINEAFASSSVCVVSSGCGCSPFICQNDYNCYIFEYGNYASLKTAVFKAVNNSLENETIRKNAYNTIKYMWNAKNASQRFSSVIDKIFKGDEYYFDSGVCSKAELIRKKWFKDKDEK